MIASDLLIKGALSIYKGIAKSGFLQSPIGSRLFTSSYFSYKRFVEDPFLGLSRKYPELFNNGHILDIGANIGYTTSVFAELLSPNFKVFSFEPELNNYRMLESAVKRLKLEDKVVINQYAVGEKEGEVEIFINDAHHADHRILTNQYKNYIASEAKTLKVKLVSIDDYLAEKDIMEPIAFIKIDVQGFEYPVWQGMQKTIAKNPNVTLAIEYAPTHMEELGYNPIELLSNIKDCGFRLLKLTSKGNLEELKFDELSVHLSGRGYFDFIATKRDL
jgi:FkbM family methyltransferase